MHKPLIAIATALLVSGCYSNANFKSANLIKPHLYPSEPSVLNAPANKQQPSAQLSHFIYFDFNSAKLSAQGQLTLDAHLEAIKQIEQGQIVLQGHTDSVGSEGDNHLLAKRRALAVWRYLIDQGVDEARLNPVSAGEDANQLPAGNAKPNPQQRFVEIIY